MPCSSTKMTGIRGLKGIRIPKATTSSTQAPCWRGPGSNSKALLRSRVPSTPQKSNSLWPNRQAPVPIVIRPAACKLQRAERARALVSLCALPCACSVPWGGGRSGCQRAESREVTGHRLLKTNGPCVRGVSAEWASDLGPLVFSFSTEWAQH